MPFDFASSLIAIMFFGSIAIALLAMLMNWWEEAENFSSDHSTEVYFLVYAALIAPCYGLYFWFCCPVYIDPALLDGALAKVMAANDATEKSDWPDGLKVAVLQSWNNKLTQSRAHTEILAERRSGELSEANAILYLDFGGTRQRTSTRDWTINGHGSRSRTYDYWTVQWRLVDLRTQRVLKKGSFNHEAELLAPDMSPHLPELCK